MNILNFRKISLSSENKFDSCQLHNFLFHLIIFLSYFYTYFWEKQTPHNTMYDQLRVKTSSINPAILHSSHDRQTEVL